MNGRATSEKPAAATAEPAAVIVAIVLAETTIPTSVHSSALEEWAMATRRLTVYLLRDLVRPSDAIASDKRPDSAPLDQDSGLDGTFFITARRASSPSWVSLVSPVVTASLDTLKSSSASGLLVLKVNEHFFAFTFGYGRSFLDLAKVEHQFGLKVALNRIDPSQIRSLDTKTFEDMVVTRNTQVSKSAELPSFGVDVSRDILRAVTGVPRDAGLAKRLSGADALVLNRDITAAQLPELCEELLAAFGEITYRQNFEWIDHLAVVSDSTTVAHLDQLLVEQLMAGDTSNTHMAMPEPLDWADIDAFKIAGTRDVEYDDLDLDQYLEELGKGRTVLTTDLLRSRQVSIKFSRSDEFDRRWNVYRALVSEQRIGAALHVLIEGRWFAVSQSLVEEVDSFAGSLPNAATSLGAARQGEIETSYNQRMASTSPNELLLLDAKIKRPGGAASGIELCDILAITGEFIHVKRKSRSSTLSHLFAQGSVSATTFVSDGPFRDEMRKAVAAAAGEDLRSKWLELIPSDGDQIDRSRYSVAYVVVADSKRTGTAWLPFFSKLNLMQNGRSLQNLGFRVSISRVATELPSDV